MFPLWGRIFLIVQASQEFATATSGLAEESLLICSTV